MDGVKLKIMFCRMPSEPSLKGMYPSSHWSFKFLIFYILMSQNMYVAIKIYQ